MGVFGIPIVYANCFPPIFIRGLKIYKNLLRKVMQMIRNLNMHLKTNTNIRTREAKSRLHSQRLSCGRVCRSPGILRLGKPLPPTYMTVVQVT